MAVAAITIPPYAFDAVLGTHPEGSADLSRLHLAWMPAQPVTQWRPAYAPASAQLHGSYTNGAQRVGLSILYYRSQRQAGVKLISSTNRLAAPYSGWWQLSQHDRAEALDAHGMQMRESVVTDGSGKLLVWSWYWVAGQRTASDYAGKVLQARAVLAGGRDDGAAVLAYAPFDEDPVAARIALRAFLGQNLPRIEAALDDNLRR